MRFVEVQNKNIIDGGGLDWLKKRHPGTLFPKGGPDSDWLDLHNYQRVKERPDTPILPHQRRISVEPALGNDIAIGYSIEDKPIEQSRQDVKAKVASLAEAKESGLYWHDIKGDGVAPFQIDDRSQRRLAALHSAIVGGNANPHKDGFTDAHNTIHTPVTGAQVKALAEAVLEYIVDIHKRKMVLCATIDATADATAVYAIDIETGWPTDNAPVLD